MTFDGKERAVWAAAFSGLSATLIGLGLARFGYAPLIPALVSADWFTTAQADYLDATNFAGYVLGTLFCAHLQRLARPATILRAAMLLTALSFVACGLKDMGLAWTAAWRLISGSSGAACMVFAPPTVLAITPERMRGVVSGVVFGGIGAGVIISAVVVPALLTHGGPQTAWFGLAAVAFILTGAAWAGWPKEAKAPETPAQKRRKVPFMVPVLYLVYGLFAAGLVPHMIFLDDFIERGLHRGIETASLTWLVYGIGALAIPPLIGRLCDRFGFATVLHVVIPVNLLAVAMPLIGTANIWLGLSAFFVGGFTIAIAALILGRLHELIPARREQYHYWGFATASFATGQAGSGYLLSFLFSDFGSYPMLFAVGAGLVGLSFAVDLFGYSRERAKR